MFFAIFGTFLKAFADVYWKKSLTYKLRPLAHNLASYPIWLILLGYFIFIWFDTQKLDILFIFMVASIISINILRQPIRQQIYREEKISLIVPYTNLNKIFVLITSFFLFQDVSYVTFYIIIFTIIIIAFSSIDFKNKKLPRNLEKIIWDEILITIEILIAWWMVITYGSILYFCSYVLIGFIVYLVVNTFTGQISDIKTAPIWYWKIRPIWALGWVAWFLSLLVIKNLWLSLSILLWFLWIWMTLLISYSVLWDVPSKKNIRLTVIVSLLIWAWYYFK